MPHPGTGHVFKHHLKRIRSQGALEKHAEKRGMFIAEHIKQFAPTFQSSQSLQELWNTAKNSDHVLHALDNICDTTLQESPIIAQSC